VGRTASGGREECRGLFGRSRIVTKPPRSGWLWSLRVAPDGWAVFIIHLSGFIIPKGGRTHGTASPPTHSAKTSTCSTVALVFVLVYPFEMETALYELLETERRRIEDVLEALLPSGSTWPSRLHRAVRHAVLGGGKRVRPILCRIASRTLGLDCDMITPAACGVELIHCYSLVHDDLPSLDNDNFRRGRPSTHAAFDPATAILTGDALLTEGLRLLACYPEGPDYASRRASAVEAVARAIGSEGMVGGQMEDLQTGGQVPDEETGQDPQRRLERIHRNKTGALLTVCLELPCIWANTPAEKRTLFIEFGRALGLAFQIADDILDETATAAELGKTPGKDAAAGKLTYTSLYGLEPARKRLDELRCTMQDLARTLEGPDGALAALGEHVCRRRS